MNINDYEDIVPGAAPQPKKGGSNLSVGSLSRGDVDLAPPGTKATPSDVSVSQDVGRSLLSKGARGLASVPGLFGDLPAMLGVETYRPPTTEEYLQKAKTAFPSAREALDYEPQTPQGRYAGSIAEFVPGALIPMGGGVRLGMRAVGAAGAGIGSQAAEDIVRNTSPDSKGSLTEGVAKLGGALAGGLSASKAAGKIAPMFQFSETRAANRLAGEMASDNLAGNAKAPLGFAAENQMAPAAVAGPRTENLLQQAASKADLDAVGRYNKSVGEVAGKAVTNVDDTLTGIFGKRVEPIDEREALSREIKSVNSENYPRVMALPEAKAIPQDQMRDLAGAMPKGLFNDLMESYRNSITDPASVGLVRNQKGQWMIPPGGASLRFWDDVKQQLDAHIRSHFDPDRLIPKPGSERLVNTLTGLKTTLTDRLDDIVKEYPKIRAEAQTLFGGRDALDDGRLFFMKQGDMKLAGLKDKFAKMTKDQKRNFAYGYSGAYLHALDKNPDAALGLLSGGKGGFNEGKIRFAFGKEDADKLIGSIHAQHLNKAVEQLVPGVNRGGYGMATATGILGGAGLSIASNFENVLQSLSFSNSLPAIASAIAGGAALAGRKALLDARERKLMGNVLRLAADPAQAERLGRLVAENQKARGVLAKVYRQAAAAAPGAFSDAEAPEVTITPNRPQRRSGGRVASHEVHADRLIAAAERAKRQIGKKTESILEKPDEIVVKALQIANQNLEG